MFSHRQVWDAIDQIAEEHGLTASGLAKRAGLDSTTFNKSKRISPDGRELFYGGDPRSTKLSSPAVNKFRFRFSRSSCFRVQGG